MSNQEAQPFEPFASEEVFAEGPRWVALVDIKEDKALQIRKSLDTGQVKLYTNQLVQGVEFPPVALADVDGVLFLVDGWHRMAANKAAGNPRVHARVTPMSYKDAVWEAARANLTHGLPLKKAAHRDIFNAFIAADKHWTKPGRKGKRLSLRELAEALGTGTSYSTLRNWLIKDHPEIHAAMGLNRAGSNSAPELPSYDPQTGFRVDALAAAAQAHSMGNLLACPHDRADVIERLEVALAELKLKPHEPRPVALENPNF